MYDQQEAGFTELYMHKYAKSRKNVVLLLGFKS